MTSSFNNRLRWDYPQFGYKVLKFSLLIKETTGFIFVNAEREKENCVDEDCVDEDLGEDTVDKHSDDEDNDNGNEVLDFISDLDTSILCLMELALSMELAVQRRGDLSHEEQSKSSMAKELRCPDSTSSLD